MSRSDSDRALANLVKTFPLDGYVDNPAADVHGPRYAVAAEWEDLATRIAGVLSSRRLGRGEDWEGVDRQISLVRSYCLELPNRPEREACGSVLNEISRMMEKLRIQDEA
jgi:hypothetical protein